MKGRVDSNHEPDSEAMLRESRFRQVVGSMPVAVGVYEAVEDGSDFAIRDLNPAAEELGGVRGTEVVGRRLTEVFPSLVDMGLLEVFRRVWRTGVPERQEAELHGDAGSRGWRENYVFKLPTGEMVAIYQDITERKRAEEALRVASAYARSLIEASLDPLVAIDAEGRITDVNTATERATGIDRTEMIGSDFAGYFTEPDKARSGYLQVFANGSVTDFPLTVRHVSGRGMEVLYNATLYRDARGEVSGVFAAARDVTGWKETEEALRRSQTELRAIYDNTPTMMCVLDPDRKVLYANRAFADFVGRPVEEMRLERACGVIGCLRTLDDPRGCGHGPGCETCNVRLAMMDALATGRAYHGIEYRTSALFRGRPRDSVFLASIARIQIAGQTSLLLCLEDITEREGVAQALRDSEEQYRSLMHTNKDAVLLSTPDGEILAANPAACRMFRCSEEEMMLTGRAGFVDLADPRWQPALEERDRSRGFHGELTLVRGDGTKFTGEVSSSIFQIREDQKRVSVVIRDVSDRLIVEHELQRSQLQLRALAARIEEVREQERSEVARELHDELGQSLTALKMDLRWLEKRLDPGRVELTEKVRGLVGLADQTIETVHRLASSLRPGLLDDLGLSAAIEWLGADCGRRSGLRCDVHVDVPERRIGPKSTTAIFRIVQEALTNIARHASASRVTVRICETDGHLEVLVADDGIGVSDAQVADARSFGLLGMRERAHALGGQVTVRGDPGKGTSVLLTIDLPSSGALP